MGRHRYPRVPAKVREDVEEVLGDLYQWSRRCHEASIHVVRSGVLPEGARVARGTHPAVLSQHSWIVLGGDVYEPHAIIDPTLWSYTGDWPEVVYTSGLDRMRKWTPHGWGTIWGNDGIPDPDSGKQLMLEGLTDEAAAFLNRCRKEVGPLDAMFFMRLTAGPVGGWPAADIVRSLVASGHSALVPIDIRGHLTDENPGGLYLPENEEKKSV